jgi:hypothetical protein
MRKKFLILVLVSSVFMAQSAMAQQADPIPEPGTMLLLGFGLIGAVGLGRKRLLKRNQREEDKG